MSTIYRAKNGGVVLAVTPEADPAYEQQLADAGIEWSTLTVVDPAPVTRGAAGVSEAPPGPREIYYRKPDGAVLAVMVERDMAYERRLERTGPEWDILHVKSEREAPQPHELQRATIRGGVVQLDKEEVVH